MQRKRVLLARSALRARALSASRCHAAGATALARKAASTDHLRRTGPRASFERRPKPQASEGGARDLNCVLPKLRAEDSNVLPKLRAEDSNETDVIILHH